MEWRSAGALAPVVLSVEYVFQTCKIKRVSDQIEPYPPNLRVVNLMVALVFAESSCTKRYKEINAKWHDYGNGVFWRYGTHAMVQTCAITSQEYISMVSFNQNMINIKVRI